MAINRILRSPEDFQIAIRTLDDQITVMRSNLATLQKNLEALKSGVSTVISSNGSGSGSIPDKITFAGDLSGTSIEQTVVGIQTIPVSDTRPLNSQLFTFNGVVWIPSSTISVNNISGATAPLGDGQIHLLSNVAGLTSSQRITVKAPGDFAAYSPDENTFLWISALVNGKDPVITSSTHNVIIDNALGAIGSVLAPNIYCVDQVPGWVKYARFYLDSTTNPGFWIPTIDMGGGTTQTLMVKGYLTVKDHNLTITSGAYNIILSAADTDPNMNGNPSIRASGTVTKPFYVHLLQPIIDPVGIQFSGSAINDPDGGRICTGIYAPGLNIVGINTDNVSRKINLFGDIVQSQILNNNSFGNSKFYSTNKTVWTNILAVDGDNGYINSSSGMVVTQGDFYVYNTCYAKVFTAHGSGSSLEEVRHGILTKEITEDNKEISAPIGSWNFVYGEDGLHVLAKKSETELKEAIIPWTSSFTVPEPLKTIKTKESVK